ncbi:protein JBTS17-like [Acanthaster planci]|uniref:Protein JBTS17-like n=1 Tax=Acanthaster planci TaxID=133434 RepID=A0A8B7ZD73_ACAPL|nr:protein JBTS17-like [Acanthaster planci]
MRLDLNVIHAPDIKSKQPWPRLAWLGKESHDLLLVDSHRIKVLCLNGKGGTKKKIAKLQAHLSHLVASNVSSNGAYLVCLLESGSLLIYNKDTDTLKTVPGIDQVASLKPSSSHSKDADKTRRSPAPLVFISSDATCILVVIGHRQLFLWEIDQSMTLYSTKQHILKGTWSCVDCEGAVLPSAECKETAVHAVFFRDSVLGLCCVCSFVFNQHSNVQISSVFLHWLEPFHLYTVSQPRFTAQWSSLSHSLSNLSASAEPVRHHGAYLTRHASSGHTLAVAVNQRYPTDTRVLFVSVMGSTAISINMKGCGCQKDIGKEKARSYWLADLAWTPNDLFLACITKQGCLTILSRLGEAVLIQSSGCSIEHEPAFFLPFHPLVTFIPSAKHRSSSFTGKTRQENLSPTSSLRSEADEKRQRYSLATHPSLPLLMLSDGYLVTVIELPSDLSCTCVVRDFLSEGRTAVNLLLERQGLEGKRLRSLSSLQLKKTMNGSDGLVTHLSQRAVAVLSNTGQQTSTLTRDGLLSTAGSDFADYAGRFSHVEEGQFVYSDPNEMQGTREMSLMGSDGVAVIVSRAQRALLSAWGLAVSHTGEWSCKLEDLLQYTAQTLVKLFTVMLQTIRYNFNSREQRYVSVLYDILIVFKASTSVLHWDIARHHGLTATYKLIRGTVRAILKHSGHHNLTTAPRSCVSILQYCEKLLSNVYSLTKVQQPTYGFHLHPYHQADIVEGSLMCQESSRIRGTMDIDHQVTLVTTRPEQPRGSREWREQRREVGHPGIVVRHSPAKRLIQTWKLLHGHLVGRYQKLVQDSSTHHSRGVRRVLLLLCGAQMKLKQLGCDVSVSLSDEWKRRIDADFLKGCQYYLQGYPEEAVTCWHEIVYQTKEFHSNGSVELPSNHYFQTSSDLALKQRPLFPTSGSSTLLSYSLLAILYTHLEQYNLVAALCLIDSLIECYVVKTQEHGWCQKKIERRLNRLMKTKASFLGLDQEDREEHPQLPCVPDPVQREVVQTLARFMSLYFTNHCLFVYPPCAAKPLPPLHLQPLDTESSRTLPIYHEKISSSVRQQQLSEIWTADTAVALLLVCGLLPEAVWLARELGDWKNALMLSVMTNQQMELEKASKKDASSFQPLCLPEKLTPLVIVKEGISVILQTPLTPPSAGGGSSVKRNSSFNEKDQRGSHSLTVSSGMRRSSSMCSLNEEDRIMQEQLSRSLTDMLTAATIADLDPTPWLLHNLMDRCLSLVAGFNTLVPEEFYLPAPPFYCPQPDYEPKDSDPEEVLYESSLRREVNDVIQLIMLVLNSAKCSLPCARWYVQQLDLLLTVDARRKKICPIPIPSVLVDHARFPVDLLKTGIDSLSLPPCTVELLRVFRDLCCTVWMLHSRDKLTLAVRKYQASRERSLHVKPQNNAEVAKHGELLEDILMWADNLHPFSSFLNLEEEVQDILLTAVSELTPTKKTVAILARHFHGNMENLSPLLQEKFQRLMVKLKRKREKSDRKVVKMSTDAGKENKRVVRYETLHSHYRYQCKLRNMTVSNRKVEIGMCELQVFEELSEKDPPKEAEQQDVKGDVRELETGASVTVKKNLGSADGKRDKTATGSKQEGTQYPIVGSREFESTPGYLDFLETFFLVAFGKIVQDNAPFSSKPKLPLIKAYSSELRQKEFGSVIRRMSVNTKLPTVELDSSTLIKSWMASKDTLTDNFKDEARDENQSRHIRSKSMFHHKPDHIGESPQLISLQKHGSRSSLNSVDPNKEKTSPSQKYKVKPPSSKEGVLQPYSSVVLNLGEANKSKAEMLQWFGRWAERQLAVYAQTQEHGDESKAVLRVRLPQQLVLNSLWLIHHLYYLDLFEEQSVPDSSVTVTIAQGGSVTLPFEPLVQSGKVQQAHIGNLRKGQRKNDRDKVNVAEEEPGAERLRKSKTKRASKKMITKIDTDTDDDDDRRKLEKKERIKKNIKEKKMKEIGSPSLDEVKQETISARPKKRRQLPEVTEEHRRTSPRHLSANKELITQFLLRAQSPDVFKEARRKTQQAARRVRRNSTELSDASDSSVNVTTSQAINAQEEIDTESSEDRRKKAMRDLSHSPQSIRDNRVSTRGIITNDVFYYTDSNSSSTLDISSLDEVEEPSNWLIDTKKGMPDSPKADGRKNDTLPRQLKSLDESSKSLNLDMKNEDVKRIVREEFMRMMEKNKTNSGSLANRDLHTNLASSDLSQPLGVRSKVQQTESDSVQPEPHLPTTEGSLNRDSAGRCGTTTQLPANQGIDAETQAPSPLMQTWHGVVSVPSSLHKEQTSSDVSQDRRGRNLKSIGIGTDVHVVQSEQDMAGLNQSKPVPSATDVPVRNFDRSDFKPDHHSTPNDVRHQDFKNTSARRIAASVGDDESVMSRLSLKDFEGNVGDSMPNAYLYGMHSGPSVENSISNNVHATQSNQEHRIPPPNYTSTLKYTLQVPLLLTVPPEKLAQGALGSAGIRYPPPPQGIGVSQSVGPSLTSTHKRVHDNAQQHRGITYHHQQMSNTAPYAGQFNNRGAAQTVMPKTARTGPGVNSSFIPPLVPPTYENPVRHLISMLHPGTQQQPQNSDSSLPPIPLLHMEPRYTAPIIPPPRHPLPLFQLKTDAKSSQFVPVEELNAFEKRQRQEKEKHPAVRARETREQMEGRREERSGPEVLAPIPLLHADLKNDLTNATRQRRRQQQDKKPTTSHTESGDTPDAVPQNLRDTPRLQKDQPHPSEKLHSNRQDTQQENEEGRVAPDTKVDQDKKRKVIFVESTKEGETSKGTTEKPGKSSEVDESDSDEEDEEGKDQTMRREDLGTGYAIKPGSYDAMLLDRDARSVLPTAAQVHYDTVQKLQTKPKSGISTGTKQTKNASTSMGKDDFPHYPPTVTDATSQYTAAATGLSDTGQILAPDIFFNLRFGSSTSDKQPDIQDKAIGKDSAQTTKGRSFISVVDIDLRDIPSPEPLPKDRQQSPSLPPAQAAPPPDEKTQDNSTPHPTNAELHYNALFLKDAHPKKTPPKVQFEDEAEMTGGPDAVTLRVLDRKTKETCLQVAQNKARSESTRQSTKERLSQRLAHMDQQLNAIEESAANIEQDFRNTSLMLHTVENLADAMVPSDTRPKADYSLKGYQLSDHSEVDCPHALDVQAHEDSARSQDSRQAEKQHGDDQNVAGMVSMVTEEEGNVTGIERGDDTALTLGISGISGVSDIIAEVIAEGDDNDVRKMGVSTQQQKAARKKIQKRRLTEQPEVQDYTWLSSDKIRELLSTPRTPRQDEDVADRGLSRKKPAERSEKERKELRDWALTQRSKNLAEYKKQRELLIEKEHKPYQPKASEAVAPSSWKEIRKQEEERDRKKKDMMEASHSERVQLAKALMAEMFIEKPHLPSEEASLSVTKRKGKSSRETGASSRMDTSEMTLRSERLPSSQMHKGTYLFIDSGAYKGRSEAWRQGASNERVDSRISRGGELGYSLEREHGELEGSWTVRLQSEELGSRGPIPRKEKFDRLGQGLKDSGNLMMLDGISEISGEDRDLMEYGSKTEPAKVYRPKPFDQVVRVQRPEVTRKQRGSTRRQKTYTEMLQEMKGESGGRKASSQSLKAKQRLYGTERIPGASKPVDNTSPRVLKTYSERLADMQQKSGNRTRLRPRTGPKRVPRIKTGMLGVEEGT